MNVLAHQRNGQGEPLVVVHGLFGSASNWRNAALQWADNFAVWAVDLRNHGNSFHRQGMNYTQMAADLLAWLDYNGLDKVNLLGHSMGGKAVMEFALRYPSRVNKLIVVDIAPIAYEPSHTEIISSLEKLKSAEPWAERRLADRFLTEHLGSETIQTRLFLLTNLRRSNDGLRLRVGIEEIAAGYADILAAPPAVAEKATFTGPTLALYGTLSDYVPASSHAVFKESFPQCQFLGLEGGHWLHAEQTADFVAAVTDFLQ